MTAIFSALAQGYTEDQILDFMQAAFPSMLPQLKKAKSAGYNSKQILSFLNNLMEEETYPAHLTPNEIEGLKQKRASEIGNKIVGAGVGILGGAAIASKLPKLIRGAIGAFGGKGPAPTPGPAPMSNAPVQPSPPIAPEEAARIANTETLNSITPEFQQYANQQIAQGREKSLAETLRDFQKMKETPAPYIPPAVQAPESPIDPTLTQKIQEDVAKMQAPERGSVVSLPAGNVGVIKDIKKEHALIDEDGKTHKVKISDLQLPDEAVQQTVARLLEIPEVDKSSTINYWAYDPEDKDLFLMFHNGETYKYHDVPEDLVKELHEMAVSPTTKKENEFGAWSPEDPKSRGATFIKKLIAHPKYKKPKKGEPENKFYRKLRKGYDYWAKLRKGG